MANFGDRIKYLRTERGLTGTELGEILGLTRSGISSWECRNRQCSQEVLKQLSEYFNCSTDYLLGISNERNPVVVNESKSFAVKLVQQLIDEKVITNPDNINPEITEMIIAALRMDVKNKKD